MPVESDHAAPTAELEAELAKLTDELESECAQLEANEDRPLEAALPTSGDADPEPEPEIDPLAAEPLNAAPAEAESGLPKPIADEPISETPDPSDSIDAIAQALVDLAGDVDATDAEFDAEPTNVAPAETTAAPTDDLGDAGLDEALGALMSADALTNEPTDGWQSDEPGDAPPIDLGAARQPSKPDEPPAPEDEESDEAHDWEPPDPMGQVESIDRSLAKLTADLMGVENKSEGAPATADAQPDDAAETTDASGPGAWAGRAGTAGVAAARRAAPAAKATARFTAMATGHAVRIGGPPAKAAGLRAARAAAPLAARALLLISKPVASRPESVRSAIGWLAMGTMFVAVVTWFFVLVRTPAAPIPSEAPAAIRANDSAFPAANDETQTPASVPSDSGT